MYVHCFLVVPITFGFVRSGHQHYVAVGVVPFLIIVLFLPVGFLFIKEPRLTCIWTQISILSTGFHVVEESRQQAWVQQVSSSTSVRERGALRSTSGAFGRALGDREDLPPGLLLGGASRASQSLNAILEPKGVAGGLPLSGSSSERLSLQGGVSCGPRSRFLPGGGVRPQSSRSSGARPHGSQSSQRSDACPHSSRSSQRGEAHPHSSRSGGVRPHRRAHAVRSRAHSDP